MVAENINLYREGPDPFGEGAVYILERQQAVREGATPGYSCHLGNILHPKPGLHWWMSLCTSMPDPCSGKGTLCMVGDRHKSF